MSFAISNSPISSDKIANDVLSTVLRNEYPDDEIVVTSSLDDTSLPRIISTLEESIESVKKEISILTSSFEPEIQNWVTHARSVLSDIASSRASADTIKELVDEEKLLKSGLGERKEKILFLKKEVEFAGELGIILGTLGILSSGLGNVDKLVQNGRLVEAVGSLKDLEEGLRRIKGLEGVVILGQMNLRLMNLKKQVVEMVERGWQNFVGGAKSEGWVRIAKGVDVRDGVRVAGEEIIGALDGLGMVKGKVDELHRFLNEVLFSRALKEAVEVGSEAGEESTIIRVGMGKSEDKSSARVYNNLQKIFQFLADHLPKSIQQCLSRILVPSLAGRLTSTYLPSIIPSALSSLPQFQAILNQTSDFNIFLTSINWAHGSELIDWVDNAPRVWLAKRREHVLDEVRKRFEEGRVADTSTVEVERLDMAERTSMETAKEATLAVTAVDGDSWDASWDSGSDEDRNANKHHKGEQPPEQKTTTLANQFAPVDDEASGWGLDDDLVLEHEESPKGRQLKPLDLPEKTAESKDEEIDWGGWGDDDGESEDATCQEIQPSSPPMVINSALVNATKSQSQEPKNKRSTHLRTLSKSARKKQFTARTVPSKESLSITSMPVAILDLVTQVISEATQLSTDPVLSTLPIAPAAPNLLEFPALILAAYRALAPIYYSSDISSRMYLSNDLTFITNEIKKLEDTMPIEIDAEPLVSLAKRVYNKELECQRTIILDYLDMTQGFAACTTYPQNEECERQMDNVIHLLKTCHEKWKRVLGKTQLFTCLGSLLATTAEKIINDTLDMSDISDEESRQLASLMGKLASEIEPCFTLEETEEEIIPQTAVYTSNWLRFRYLEQVLECSLVDLMYLYNDQSLSMEFEKEELVDLVKALFRDSENRRKCLDAIRKGPTGPKSC